MLTLHGLIGTITANPQRQHVKPQELSSKTPKALGIRCQRQLCSWHNRHDIESSTKSKPFIQHGKNCVSSFQNTPGTSCVFTREGREGEEEKLYLQCSACGYSPFAPSKLKLRYRTQKTNDSFCSLWHRLQAAMPVVCSAQKVILLRARFPAV